MTHGEQLEKSWRKHNLRTIQGLYVIYVISKTKSAKNTFLIFGLLHVHRGGKISGNSDKYQSLLVKKGFETYTGSVSFSIGSTAA